MSYIPRQYRQGDLLLVAEDNLPPEIRLFAPCGGACSCALMSSEATGQGTHVVPLGTAASAFLGDGEEGTVGWLQVKEPGVTVQHPEHAPLQLEPGIWRVVRQREYDPATAASRRATD